MKGESCGRSHFIRPLYINPAISIAQTGQKNRFTTCISSFKFYVIRNQIILLAFIIRIADYDAFQIYFLSISIFGKSHQLTLAFTEICNNTESSAYIRKITRFYLYKCSAGSKITNLSTVITYSMQHLSICIELHHPYIVNTNATDRSGTGIYRQSRRQTQINTESSTLILNWFRRFASHKQEDGSNTKKGYYLIHKHTLYFDQSFPKSSPVRLDVVHSRMASVRSEGTIAP